MPELAAITDSKNVAELLSDKELSDIGLKCAQSFENDKTSRMKWEEKMQNANDLALQIRDDKTFPWANASNVKFPLLTIAAIQWAARAYPALVRTPDLVKYRVQGADPQGEKAARAQRISAHMSYQLLEKDEHWEEDQDRAFMTLPILGCVFKKTIYQQGVRSYTVLPRDLVVHYYAKSIETAERVTEIFQLSDRIIRERVLKGEYLEVDLPPEGVQDARPEDERQGLAPPIQDADRPRTVCEQHCYLDLDNDGYKEPYVVTFHRASRKVLRIVHRFREVISEQSVQIDELRGRIRSLVESLPKPGENGTNARVAVRAEATVKDLQGQIQALEGQKPKVLRIEPFCYYTKYSFIPAPDGGFYDLGFGSLLGPLNDSVDTLINQLIDSGTLQNGSNGFIGKGARMKGGKMRFSPFEWKRVDVSGSALRESIVPLPINPPSTVLFQLLGLLINYTERVSSVTETLSGENPGQNTPAYNMSAMLEQGLQVFNAIFKRTYRAFRGELRKVYDMNSRHLTEEYFEYHDMPAQMTRFDYQGNRDDVIPAADPNAFASQEKQVKAQMVAERAMMVAGYNPIAVEMQLLEAWEVPMPQALYPIIQGKNGPELAFPPQPDPEFEIKRMEEERRTIDSRERHERELMIAHAEVALKEMQALKMMAEAEMLADRPELERMKIIMADLADQRKALAEAAKIEAGANNGVGGASGDTGASEPAEARTG